MSVPGGIFPRCGCRCKKWWRRSSPQTGGRGVVTPVDNHLMFNINVKCEGRYLNLSQHLLVGLSSIQFSRVK